LNQKLTRWAAAGVLSIGASGSVLAGSVTEPGETIGAATGAPAPPGLYFANTVMVNRRIPKALFIIPMGFERIPFEQTAMAKG